MPLTGPEYADDRHPAAPGRSEQRLSAGEALRPVTIQALSHKNKGEELRSTSHTRDRELGKPKYRG